MMDSMGFNDCLLFIQEFGTDCFCLVTSKTEIIDFLNQLSFVLFSSFTAKICVLSLSTSRLVSNSSGSDSWYSTH